MAEEGALKLLLPLLLLLLALLLPRPAWAMTYAGVTPSDSRANQTSGVSHFVTFKASTGIGSVDEIKIDFVSAGGWFIQGGGCSALGTSKTSTVNWPFDVVSLPGSISCSVSGAVIDITGITTGLSAGNVYGVRVNQVVAILGTPTAGVYSVIIKTYAAGILQESQTTKVPIFGDTQISASATVPILQQADINFSGFGAPTALVVIQDGGSIVGTVTVLGDGSWSKTITFQTGSHSVSLFQEDSAGRRSSSISFTITVSAGVNQSFSNIYFSPTIALSATVVKVGDTLNIFGVAQPASTINGTINSDPIPFTTASDGNGVYNFPWTVSVPPGLHSTLDKSTNGTLISDLSQVLGFQVNPNCRGADLNQDGRVNLTDFSILLFNWAQSPPGNRCADINSDGTVNLTDFSIMLFAWTG